MGANFTPTQEPYKHTKKLPYSCMKVLPTVFDDALSYYETLCQVTDKLNEVIEYVNSARLGTPQIVLLSDNDEIDDFIDWEHSTISRDDITTVLAYRIGDEIYFTLLGFNLTNPVEEFRFKDSVGSLMCYEYFPLVTMGDSGYNTVLHMVNVHEHSVTFFTPSPAPEGYCCFSGHATVLTDKNHSFETTTQQSVV